ncbi:hypothetical protein A2Z33_04845 [Candidatus Gottesmanbacteria bacterium RBG_16_52_11]|uniref:Nucleotidyl transferase domain-containing protein n=1 Tax=Candidatus Gottesmanbacteria bacterium RBG_16_52_11 TaxID=1798374 RepID=A0A1F5YUL3_9BACT|nr:MAG: hypothetical protein A2Z33_04845 [Candidatus Gottesmanbacteria bacterium RBG_16_52_11]
MNKPLTAVVLAGGIGTRFAPFSGNKLFMQFMGKPLIHYSLTQSLPDDVSRVVIIASPENYGDLGAPRLGVPSTVVVQDQPRGMADALITAGRELSGPVLVLIADHLVPKAVLSDVVSHARKSKSFGVLPGWKRSEYFPGGYLKVSGNTVTGIVEKPVPGQEPGDMVYISGTYIDDAAVLINELSKTGPDGDDAYERTLTRMMGPLKFTVHRYEGPTATLKYPWHALDVFEYLAATSGTKGRGRNVVFKENVIIEGDVRFGDNVRVYENTKISGPCYIGSNTVIGNGNIIRHSHIGADCVTGFSTDITRSYIGDGCWFHTNYIGDSVLEGNVSMGSGAVLANLRLDEGGVGSFVKEERIDTGRKKLGACIARSVRIGVNASIMPGVKIGRNSMIGAGLVISEDIAADSYVSGTTVLSVRRNERTVPQGDRGEFRDKLK